MWVELLKLEDVALFKPIFWVFFFLFSAGEPNGLKGFFIFVIVLLRNFLVMAEWVNKDSSLGSLVFWGSSVRVLIG